MRRLQQYSPPLPPVALMWASPQSTTVFTALSCVAASPSLAMSLHFPSHYLYGVFDPVVDPFILE